MKNIICCIAAILIISLQSCLSVIANKYKINSKSPKLEKIDVYGKEVYFLGMSHQAKKEIYDNTKLLIEDFQAKGFIFYLESINDFENKIIILDTLAVKKIRKLTELDFSIKYSKSQNPYFQK